MTIDWVEVLALVDTAGTAYVAGALDTARTQQLLDIELPWKELDERLPSGVSQQYSFASLVPRGDSTLSALCQDICRGIQDADAAGRYGLDEFAFNEASFHRYRAGDLGLTCHRDMDFYRMLIVGITLEGTGELHLFDDEGNRTQTWRTQAGDVYAFRAPGLSGCVDGRPRHATGPTGGRTSLTLRYNQHGYLGGWGDVV